MNLIRCYASAVLVCSTLACSGSSSLPSSDKVVKEEVGKETSLEVVSRVLDSHSIKVDDNEELAKSARFRAAGDSMSMAEIEAEWATEPEMTIARYFSERFQTEELRQIAEAGVAWAQYDLAQRYYVGESHLQDFERAEYWLLSAAEQGYGRAMHDLMTAYFTDGPSQENAEKALFWSRRLADQGAPEDTYEVAGIFYFGSHGVPEDKVEAIRLYELAAEKGSPVAMQRLGQIYSIAIPLFTPPDSSGDNVLAYMWFNLASSRSAAPSAEEQRNYVGGLLSRAEILEGQRLAREWDEAHPLPPSELSRVGVSRGKSMRYRFLLD